jgi:hypothetical protein
MRQNSFPIVVQVSSEPDTVTGGAGAPWRGFEACIEKLVPVRRAFAESWGTPIVLSWMMRADLHIEEAWGDAGWGFRNYSAELQAVVDEGDFVGLHAHPIREHLQVEDYRDTQWTLDTLGAGIDAYDAHFGHPPACVSWGRGWTSDSVLALLSERGVAVDMSVFPGRDQTVTAGSVEMLVDVQDLSTVPRRPYYPADSDWRIEADHPSDGTWVLPFTTSATDAWMSPTQRATRRLKWLATRRHEYRRRTEQNYFFNVTWPGFPSYVAALAATEQPYLTLSIRASRLLETSPDDVAACFRVLEGLQDRYGAYITDPVTAVRRSAVTAEA